MRHLLSPRPLLAGLLLLVFALGSLSAARPALAQIDEQKVDSLRWLAMEWRKEGNGELINVRDSLRLCITTEEDDGSGVTVTPGDGEGIAVVTPGPDFSTFRPGRGLTFVWEGRDEGDASIPYDVAIVDFVDEPDPEDGLGSGIGVGTLFPELDFDTYRVVITDDGEVVTDTLVTDPGPDPDPPGPFPFPDPPTITWIDTGFPPLELCDKHFLVQGADGFSQIIGPQARPAQAMTPEVGYVLELAVSMPMKVRGSGKAIMGNRLFIIPQNPTTVPKFITQAHIIPRHQMESILVDATVQKFGLEHRGLGGGVMAIVQDSIMYSGIGSSGLDGIQTMLPEGTSSVWTDMRPLSLRPGESLSWALAGEVAMSAEESNDSLVVLFLQGLAGNRIELGIDAHPMSGWDAFTLQVVSGGKVVRSRKVPNGFSFGLRNVVINGFAKATVAEQGWNGFKVDIRRNGRPAEIRFLPTIPNESTFSEVRLTAASPFEDLTLFYEEIKWTVVAAGAPARRASESEAVSAPIPHLLGHYPEPFNPQTTIAFDLPLTAHVRLDVFDVTGRRVATLADGIRTAGRHTARFDGTGLASGVYLYRLQTGAVLLTRTMLLVK